MKNIVNKHCKQCNYISNAYGIKKQHTNRQNGPGQGKKKVINEDNTAQVINGGAI